MMQESYWGHATAFWHKLLTWQGIVKIHTCADWEANVKFCGCVSVLLGKTSERPTVPCVPLSFSKNQSLCWRDMDPLLFGKTHRIQLLSSCQFVWVHLTVALLLICITLQLSWREQHCVNALIRVVKHSPEIITNHVPGARNHGSCLHVSGETVVGGGDNLWSLWLRFRSWRLGGRLTKAHMRGHMCLGSIFRHVRRIVKSSYWFWHVPLARFLWSFLFEVFPPKMCIGN